MFIIPMTRIPKIMPIPLITPIPIPPQLSTETLLLTFGDDGQANQFAAAVTKIKNKEDTSMFSERTEESSASQSVTVIVTIQ